MEKVSTARIALKWGLIYGLASIAFITIMYTFNLFDKQWITTVASLAIAFGILYLAFSEYKVLNEGFMTFGEGVGLGMLLFATATVISSLYDFIYKKFIDTEVINKMLEITERQYEKMGMSQEVIDQALEQARPFMEGPIAILIAIAIGLFSGLICSLIMSAIMKKNKPVFD